MNEAIAVVLVLGIALIFREAFHQWIKSRQFKKICAFLEKASR